MPLINPTNIIQYQLYLSRTIAVLAGVCALSVFLYGTFLLMAVAHTAARTTAQKQIATITGHLGDLEMNYLAATKTLTPEHAHELGFVAPASVAVATVYASAGGHQLSMRAAQ